MESNKGCGSWTLSLLLSITSVSSAEDYDYEINLGFDRTSLHASQLLTPPGGAIFDSRDVDTDEFSLTGTWYYNGLSDNVGPRARAVFMDRASSLSIFYQDLEQSFSAFRTNEDPLSPILPAEGQSRSESDSVAVNLRYVDRDSGWLGSAGWLTSDSRFFADGMSFDDPSVDAWNVTVGRYLYDTTALTFGFNKIEGQGASDTSTVNAEFTHLGGLGDRWQYAVDLGYGRSDVPGSADQDIWAGAFSVYPTRDVEFGISVEHVSVDGGRFLVDPDTTSLQGFASWFVTPNVQLAARYRVDDIEVVGSVVIADTPTQRDSDQESFGISATVRF